MSVIINHTLLGIGSAIVSGTPNSVLFIDASGFLAQRNPGFTYDGSTLALRVNGTANIQEWQDSSGNILEKIDANGTLTIRPSSSASDKGIVFDVANLSGFRQVIIDAININDSGSGITLSVNGTPRVVIAANGFVRMPSIVTDGGLFITSLEMSNSGHHRFAFVDPASSQDIFQLDGRDFNRASLGFYGKSSTTNSRQLGLMDVVWADNTDASRKARITFNVYDTAAREAIRIESDGTYALTSIGGAAVAASTACLITSPTATYSGLVVKGASSQSVNLQEWQDSGGTTLIQAKPAGGFNIMNTVDNGTNTWITGIRQNDSVEIFKLYNSGGLISIKYPSTECYFNADATGTTVLNGTTAVDSLVRQGETGNAKLHWSFNGSNPLFEFSGAVQTSFPVVQITLSTATNTGLVIKGAASQSGALLQLQGISSTSTAREQLDVTASWATSTDASRKARTVFNIYDTAPRECLRLESSGSAAMLGFFGASAVLQPSTTGTTTGFTAGAGTTAKSDSTFTGNTGTAAYTVGDIVLALKQVGLLAA